MNEVLLFRVLVKLDQFMYLIPWEGDEAIVHIYVQEISSNTELWSKETSLMLVIRTDMSSFTIDILSTSGFLKYARTT